MPEFEPITGRYFTMELAGESCRIYVEEAGDGIPLVCLHTTGKGGPGRGVVPPAAPSVGGPLSGPGSRRP